MKIFKHYYSINKFNFSFMKIFRICYNQFIYHITCNLIRDKFKIMEQSVALQKQCIFELSPLILNHNTRFHLKKKIQDNLKLANFSFFPSKPLTATFSIKKKKAKPLLYKRTFLHSTSTHLYMHNTKYHRSFSNRKRIKKRKH